MFLVTIFLTAALANASGASPTPGTLLGRNSSPLFSNSSQTTSSTSSIPASASEKDLATADSAAASSTSTSPSTTTTYAVPTITLNPATSSFTECLKNLGQDCTRTAGMQPVDMFGEYGLFSFIVTDNPYYNWLESSVSMPYCSTLWYEELFEWYATVPLVAPTATTTPADSVESDLSLPSPSGGFLYSASNPCCSTCTLFGGNVEVYHWPSPAPTPAVSMLYDEASNFTFVSPTIYVAFQSLYATDLCGTVDSSVYAHTSLGFNPGELSTRIIYYTTSPVEYYNWTQTAWDTSDVPWTQARQYQAHYGMFDNIFSWTDGTWHTISADCKMSTTTTMYPRNIYSNWVNTLTTVVDGVSLVETLGHNLWLSVATNIFDTYTWSFNPCSPELEIPTQLYTLNSGWQQCTTVLWGFFDPPYVLTQGGSLEAFTTAAPVSVADQITTSAAAAGSTPTPATIAPTPAATTTTKDPIPTQVSDPVSVQDPSINQPAPVSSTIADPVPRPSEPTKVHEPTSPAPKSSATPGPGTTVVPDPTSVQNPATNIPAQITIGSSTVTANPSSAYVVGSQTLAPGSQITHSGTLLSLASSGDALIIGGSTTQAIALNTQQPGSAIGGAQITAEEEYVVASQTLKAGGPAITVSGTVLSLLSGGSSVAVGGTHTIAASEVVGASESLVTSTLSGVGLGGAIASLGGFSAGDSTTTASEATSSGASSLVLNGTAQIYTAQGGMRRTDRLNWTYIWGPLFAMELLSINVLL